MTTEIRSIAVGLNTMADRLQELMQAQQESAEKIKNAEIAALEAQLNPIFCTTPWTPSTGWPLKRNSTPSPT